MASLRTYLSLAGFLPSVTLVLAFYVLLRASRGSMWRIALLALPGTIAHELSHFVVGALLLAKPHGFSIRPKASGNTWTLGAVSFGNVPIAWLCLVHVLLPLWNSGQWGWWTVGGYLTATALFAALPSFQDLKLGGRSLLLYGALVAFLWWAYTRV